MNRHIDERGLTSALKAGIKAASGEIIIWMDCDFQMPPSKIPERLATLDEGYDAAVGSRFIEGGGDVRYDKERSKGTIVNVHRMLSKLMCLSIAAIFRMNFRDWSSGFIAIRKKVFDNFKLEGDYGEYFIYLIHYAIRSGFKVKEIPYVLTPRLRGESKSSINYLDMAMKGRKYLWAILKLAMKPGK
jgi:dolichol-phosphate mannosyltransferase